MCGLQMYSKEVKLSGSAHLAYMMSWGYPYQHACSQIRSFKKIAKDYMGELLIYKSCYMPIIVSYPSLSTEKV